MNPAVADWESTVAILRLIREEAEATAAALSRVASLRARVYELPKATKASEPCKTGNAASAPIPSQRQATSGVSRPTSNGARSNRSTCARTRTNANTSPNAAKRHRT